MDPTRWPHAPNARILARQESDDLHEEPERMRMKAIVGVLIAALAFASGCVKTDWIDRTLVTVDVTGTWGGVEGFSTATSFELEQQGSTVRGFIRATGTTQYAIAGPISGTVAGDVFRFKDTRGNVVGELTVSGDEMTGTMSKADIGGAGVRQVSLRRVDSSSRPASPPR